MLKENEAEKLLLLRVANGDQSAFAQIVRQYTRIVYPYLLYWVKQAHQAEELTQDLFVRLWDKRDKLTGVTNFGGYLYTTARNIASDALDRKLLPTESLDADQLSQLAGPAAPSLEWKELSAILERGINALPPRRKEVFLLSRTEGMTYEDIAGQLRISRSAVRQHIVEALVFLRHYLKQHGDTIILLVLNFFF